MLQFSFYCLYTAVKFSNLLDQMILLNHGCYVDNLCIYLIYYDFTVSNLIAQFMDDQLVE